jgi:type I restriction enzyme, S subunit
MNMIRLSEVAKISKGKKADSSSDCQSNGQVRYIQIEDLRNDESMKYTDAKGVIVTSQDVIIAWDGANAGTIGYGLSGVIGSTLARIEIDSNKFFTPFIGKFLQSQSRHLRDKATGATIPHINKKVLMNLQIPHLSLEDQKRIVSILDQAEALRRKRKEAIKLLDEYVQSVFLEMFGDPITNPKKMQLKPLGQITEKITDGTHKTPKYVPEGVKFISAKNVKKGKIDWRETKHITQKEHDEISKRCDPKIGDILLTKSGSLGMAALVDVKIEFSLFESLALIRPKTDLIECEYLKEYLNLKQIAQHYLQRSKGVAVKHLHLIDIKSLPVILPPKESQLRFITTKKKIEDIADNMSNQLESIDNQFNSMMQRVFTGTL